MFFVPNTFDALPPRPRLSELWCGIRNWLSKCKKSVRRKWEEDLRCDDWWQAGNFPKNFNRRSHCYDAARLDRTAFQVHAKNKISLSQ